MRHFRLLYLMVVFLCYSQANAQCDNTLVEKAALQSGSNAVYLREFKVKFDGSEPGKVIPVAKYPVLLSKNNTYRFNVCNAEEFEGEVILQLYLKDQLLGSTYNTDTSTDLQYFDFHCTKAATYEVVMSFNQGKPGCAVGILSLLTEKAALPEDEELDILYALADNPILIYDDEDEYVRVEASIDNGSVTKVDGINYIIHPESPGIAVLTLRVLNPGGIVKNFRQKRFAVLALDKPYAIINGVRDGKISREEWIRSGRIELWFSPELKCNHQIVSFTISDNDDLISGITSPSGKLTRSQRNWLNSLPAGTKVYIKNIRAKTYEHVVMDIDPVEIEVE